MATATATVLLILLSYLTGGSEQQQLVIHVRNHGGDVLRETINANLTDDTVSLEYQRPDATLLSMLIDFRAEVLIYKALVLGEEERGQSQYQVICFVIHYPKGEFISSDAMAKLRQKNPGTIRQPEEDRGKEQVDLDLFVVLESSSVISRHLRTVCSEAANTTYTRESDLKAWASPKAGMIRDVVALSTAVKRFPSPVPAPAPAPAAQNTPYNPATVYTRCKDGVDWWKPCLCYFEACVGWYPCGLKYCKGRDSSGKLINYRCGIKTCRKCRTFSYYVRQKQLCLWDE